MAKVSCPVTSPHPWGSFAVGPDQPREAGNLPTPVGIVLIADVVGAGIRKLPARTGIARSLPVQSVLPPEPPTPA